jgi:hypothetical protein
MHENAEEMVKEKLQRVNEPGVVVKCLFDPMTMDDIEDIAENFTAENLRNASHIKHKQTFQPQQLAFRQASVIILCFNLSFNFWVNHVLLTLLIDKLISLQGHRRFQVTSIITLLKCY